MLTLEFYIEVGIFENAFVCVVPALIGPFEPFLFCRFKLLLCLFHGKLVVVSPVLDIIIIAQ